MLGHKLPDLLCGTSNLSEPCNGSTPFQKERLTDNCSAVFINMLSVYCDVVECKYHCFPVVGQLHILYNGNVDANSVAHYNVEIYRPRRVFGTYGLVAFKPVQLVVRKRNASSVSQQCYFAHHRKYVSCKAGEVGEVAFGLFYDGRRYAQVETTGG